MYLSHCLSQSLSPPLSPSYARTHRDRELSLEKMTLTGQISATLFGNQSSKHLLNISAQLAPLILLGQPVAIKYMWEYFQGCVLLKHLDPSAKKRKQAGENMLQYPLLPLGAIAIFTGLFFKKKFSGEIYVLGGRRGKI